MTTPFSSAEIVDVACEQENVALNLYDFVVRRPRTPAEKYGLRAYDEIILAPMVAAVSCLCFQHTLTSPPCSAYLNRV